MSMPTEHRDYKNNSLGERLILVAVIAVGLVAVAVWLYVLW